MKIMLFFNSLRLFEILKRFFLKNSMLLDMKQSFSILFNLFLLNTSKFSFLYLIN